MKLSLYNNSNIVPVLAICLLLYRHDLVDLMGNPQCLQTIVSTKLMCLWVTLSDGLYLNA